MSSHNNKTIVKNTIFLYFRMFITMLVSLYTVRVVLKTLGVVDYGVYNVIGGVVTSLAFISNVLANASQRFFSVGLGENNPEKLKKTFGLIIFTYAITAICILILAETLGLWFVCNKMDIPSDRMDAAMIVFHFAVASFIMELLTNPFYAMIIAKERMNIYAYVSIVQSLLKLGIVYFLVLLSFDKLKLYAILVFIVVVLTNSIYILYCKRNFSETRIAFNWDKKMFQSIFSYSSWTMLGTVAYIFNTQGLNILFNLFFGPVANAAYAIGNQISTTINSFATNFFVATRPPMTKSYAEGDFDYTKKLFAFSSKMIFSLLFIMIVPLFTEVEFILSLWLGKAEQYMPEFVRMMLIYVMVLCISEPITTIVQAAGKVKLYHGIVDSFTLLTLPLSYIAFHWGLAPYYGFAISISIFVIAHIIRLCILKNFFPFSLRSYLFDFIIPALLTLILTFIAIYGVRVVTTNSIILLIVSGILATTIVFSFLLNHTERLYITNMLKNKIRNHHE